MNNMVNNMEKERQTGGERSTPVCPTPRPTACGCELPLTRRMRLGLCAATWALLLLLLLQLPPRSAAAAAPPPASPPPFTLGATIASVWQQPTNLPRAAACDPALEFDLGCNSFWLSADAWSVYEAQRATMWPLVRSSMGDAPTATVLLYIGAWLADAMHGGRALSRLATVASDIRAAGMRVIPFIGRPEFRGNGTWAETGDPVHDTVARAYLLARVTDILNTTGVGRGADAASVYWLGALCHARGAAFCSPDDVASLTAALATTVRASGLSYLQHVDGTFFDACWPQPCNAWEYGGYSPASLLAGGADGILGESWAMGALRGSVEILFSAGVCRNTTLLLLDDTPNCDTEGGTHPCSTGSLAGDSAAWDATRHALGLTAWGVWDAIDGGRADANFYGDLNNWGTQLTPKGELHRARAQQPQ